jgi:hypothetical protein
MSFIDHLLGAVVDAATARDAHGGPIEHGVRATGRFVFWCLTVGRWSPRADGPMALVTGFVVLVSAVILTAKLLIAVTQ